MSKYTYKDTSLIKKALTYAGKKSAQNRKPLNQAQIDLCFAHCAGEISGRQLCQALGVKYNSSTTYRMVHWAMKCYLLGL